MTYDPKRSLSSIRNEASGVLASAYYRHHHELPDLGCVYLLSHKDDPAAVDRWDVILTMGEKRIVLRSLDTLMHPDIDKAIIENLK